MFDSIRNLFRGADRPGNASRHLLLQRGNRYWTRTGPDHLLNHRPTCIPTNGPGTPHLSPLGIRITTKRRRNRNSATCLKASGKTGNSHTLYSIRMVKMATISPDPISGRPNGLPMRRMNPKHRESASRRFTQPPFAIYPVIPVTRARHFNLHRRCFQN